MQRICFAANFQQPVVLELVANEGALRELNLLGPTPTLQHPEMEQEGEEAVLLLKAKKQLLEYLAGTRKEFNLPLAPQGTKFQNQVWDALKVIPFGETRSYKEIAGFVGGENYCRAVGGANRSNPLPLFIPCHRVINQQKKLQGYSFGGIETQSFLLRLEQLL